MSSITTRVVRNARRNGVTVLNRKQWGSKYPDIYKARRRRTKSGEWGPFTYKADTVVQHITVTRPSGDFAADVRLVERIGVERFGSGVSYNFLVDMTTGKVAVGQPLDSKGTHTVNDKDVPGFSHDQNLVARAIAVIGMPGTKLSRKAEDAIVSLLSAMRDEGAITVGFDYVPHSMFAYKDCPCDATRNRMNEIRSAVAKAWEPKR
jgi:hypothetical protein